MKKLVAKLGTMRKAVEWVVYPASKTALSDNALVIQSDSRIARFDPVTGKGLLSAHRPNGAYFVHLTKFLGATEVTVPPEVIAAALDAQPKSGDQIGPGVFVA